MNVTALDINKEFNENKNDNEIDLSILLECPICLEDKVSYIEMKCCYKSLCRDCYLEWHLNRNNPECTFCRQFNIDLVPIRPSNDLIVSNQTIYNRNVYDCCFSLNTCFIIVICIILFLLIISLFTI
tara:strand:- start:105 stop:485 length:381 start_codon:yes stop_codon:yes gene_type:complete